MRRDRRQAEFRKLDFPLARSCENPGDFSGELIKRARLQKEPVTVPGLDRTVSGYHQDRNVLGSFVGFEVLHDIPTADDREPQIQEDKLGLKFDGLMEAVSTVARFARPISLPRKKVGKHLAVVIGIIHNQDMGSTVLLADSPIRDGE
jgi:hypothetical protein